MIAPALVLLIGQLTVVQSQGELRQQSRSLEAGEIAQIDTPISTGDLGWAELWLGNRCRMYLSAGSQLSVDEAGNIHLISGRVWLLYAEREPAPLRLRGGSTGVAIAPGSSVVFERHPSRGFRVAQSRGQTNLAGARIGPGKVGLLTQGKLRILDGGQGLFELVNAERRQALDDPTRLTAFLRAEATSIRPAQTRKDDRLPTLREGRPQEEALRPPPFFEEEVPQRGPNVEVTVTYEE